MLRIQMRGARDLPHTWTGTKIERRRKQTNENLWETCRRICARVCKENLIVMEVAETPPYAFFTPECESSPSIKQIKNTIIMNQQTND